MLTINKLLIIVNKLLTIINILLIFKFKDVFIIIVMSSNKKILECICGKKYASPPSLCVHRKQCNLYLEQKNNNNIICKIKEIPEIDNNSLQFRINELEQQLKLKDLEIKLKDFEINNLKTQINSNINNIIIQKQRNQTPPRNDKNEFNLITYLNDTCKNAINFDDMWDEIIFNADYNKWLICIKNKNEEFNLLKQLHIFSYPKGVNFYTDFFCDSFNKLEHFNKPIFCSDAKRNIYYIKNNDEWLKIDYIDLFKKIYNKLNIKPILLLDYIFSPAKKITETQFYKIYPDIQNINIIKKEHYDKLVYNFCDITFQSFLIKCNTSLKTITCKNYETYVPSLLDANENELFKNEPESDDEVENFI